MRVFVTGPTGSGKSTLAKTLAVAAAAPLFPLDDIHWIRHPSGDRRRDPADRLSMLEDIVRRNEWVIEGVQFKWADLAMDRADRIVVLDLPRWRSTARLLRRFAARRLPPGADNRGTLKALAEEMRWSADDEGHELAMLFGKLAQWPTKLIVARTAQDERALPKAVLKAA